MDVDTRSDIYSLGVLLYELLTSTTPFDTRELLKAGLDEVRRVIRDQEPVRPSARLSTMIAADLTSLSLHRQAEPPKLIREVRGDLDWIVMKALEKDRTRRYETANGLALDVQRYLASEPISARPRSKLYKLRKAVFRNKLLFTGIGVIALLMLVSLIVVSASLVLGSTECPGSGLLNATIHSTRIKMMKTLPTFVTLRPWRRTLSASDSGPTLRRAKSDFLSVG